jgi:hypothetical protein
MSKPGSPILVLGAIGRTGRRAAASGAWTPR